MTLKEFAEKRIVQIIPSITFWSSFISLFIFGPSFKGDGIVFGITILSVISMCILNGILGIKPPEGHKSEWMNDLNTNPMYKSMSGNIHHNHHTSSINSSSINSTINSHF